MVQNSHLRVLVSFGWSVSMWICGFGSDLPNNELNQPLDFFSVTLKNTFKIDIMEELRTHIFALKVIYFLKELILG